MSHTPSQKSQHLPSFIAMDVTERALSLRAEGREIISLALGEPDFDTPDPVKEAGIRAIREGRTKYTHSLGNLKLRETIASHYQKTYGLTVDPGRILVSNGTSPALFIALAAALEAGDEVILSDPAYACYPNTLEFLGAKPVTVVTSPQDGFLLRADAVRQRITSRTRGILVNSPCNPTGYVMPPEELKALAGLGVTVFSDEIYHGLAYEGECRCMLEYTDDAFVFNGFSKLYAMTGWRLGYVIVPEPYLRAMQKIHQNFYISASDFVQWAGIAALTECDDHVAVMKRTFNERRLYVCERLERMGIGLPRRPNGAFYALADIRRWSGDSLKFAFDLLEKAGVAVTPGIDFGSNLEGYVRISYANSMENLALALDRMEAWLAAQPSR